MISENITQVTASTFVENIKTCLKEYLANVYKEEDPVTNYVINIQNEEKLVNLNIFIQYPDLDGNKYTFDEWLASTQPNILIEGEAFTDLNIISSYSFGLLISNLIKGTVLSLDLLGTLSEINKVCFSLNRKTIVTPLLYREYGSIVMGLSYMLESDNKKPILLVIEVIRI